MGRLAVLGAIGGAAEGAEKGILLRQQEESARETADIDYQRKMAFERLQQKNREALERMKQEGATGRTEIGADAQIQVAGMQTGSRESMQQEDIAMRERMQDDAQQHAIDLENIQIAAGKYARTTASTNPQFKAMVDRYQFRQETTSGFDPESGMPTETGVTVMSDNVTGQTYVQKDDKFVPRGSDRTPARAPNPAVKALYENLHMAPDFIDKYGYLPLGFFEAKRTFDLAQAGYGTLGTPQPPQE